MAESLQGKTAIVTGAGRGIGRATACALAGEGVRVALLARSEGQLEELADELRQAGGDALSVRCDVSVPEQIETAVGTCVDQFGRVDILVNNAGTFLEAPVAEMALDQWEYSLRVNATAPFLFCRAVLPHMVEQGGGKIINIASTSGVKGYLKQSAYCASKHALVGFAKCLAIEAKPHNVHVHTLCPGGVRTDFIAGTYLSERLEGQTMLEPENIAELVVFVARQPANVDIEEVVVRRCHAG